MYVCLSVFLCVCMSKGICPFVVRQGNSDLATACTVCASGVPVYVRLSFPNDGQMLLL